MKTTRKALVIGALVLALSGCSPAAESAYTLELVRCVDKAATLADSRACRAGVDARWGVTRDGGR